MSALDSQTAFGDDDTVQIRVLLMPLVPNQNTRHYSGVVDGGAATRVICRLFGHFSAEMKGGKRVARTANGNLEDA